MLGREADHPVCILMDEHEVIYRNLEELWRILNEINNSLATVGELAGLSEIAQLLVEAESHHTREEKALFTRLENQGVTELTQYLRQEHKQLRLKKHLFAELTKPPVIVSSSQFVQKLNETGQYLVNTLKAHIFTEEEILYPMALDVLGHEEWKLMVTEFNRIGYCQFTYKAFFEGCRRCVLNCPSRTIGLL